MEPGTHGFHKFHKIPKKDQTLRKVWTQRKEKELPAPPGQPPFVYWAWCLWYGIFPLAILGWLPGCAPSQLLHRYSLISWVWETGRSPWFLRNNWKHQCYWHSSGSKPKTQQLLGGKLTLSQPKPGQCCTRIFLSCNFVWTFRCPCATFSAPCSVGPTTLRAYLQKEDPSRNWSAQYLFLLEGKERD